MSYRKAANLDKNLIFAEYFNDEQSVRRNGGVPTDVVFDKGTVDFALTDAKIQYPAQFSHQAQSPFSCRVIVKKNSLDDYGWLFVIEDNNTYELRVDQNTGYLRSYVMGDNVGSTGVSIPIGEWFEIVHTCDGFNDHNYYINGELDYNATNSVDPGSFNKDLFFGIRGATVGGDVEQKLAEFYNKELTAEEVTNLYNDARYVVPSLEHPQQVDAPMNVSNCVNLSYDDGLGGGFSNGTPTGFKAVSDGTSFQGCGTADEISFVNGQKVIITFDLVRNSGIMPSFTLRDSLGGSTVHDGGYLSPNEGSNIHEVEVNSTTTGVVFFHNSSQVTDYEITNLSVFLRTVQPTSKILHVTAFDGVCRNLLSGDHARNLMDAGKGTFNDGTVESWVPYGTNIVINEDNALKIEYVDHGSGARMYFRETYDINTDLIDQKTYKWVFTAKKTPGNQSIRLWDGVANFYQAITDEYEEYEMEFVCSHTVNCYITPADMSAGEIVWIKDWRLEELIPEVVNTDIEVVKEGQIRVPRFNGSTSKVDCGDYNDLTGDITILSWVSSSGSQGIESPQIIKRGDLAFAINTTWGQLFVTSDDSTYANSGNFSIMSDDMFLATLIRKASGEVTFYINGKQEDTADQDSGTPVSEVISTKIGNNVGSNRGWKGLIPEVIILEGLLTPAEISQYFSSTKHLYNK